MIWGTRLTWQPQTFGGGTLPPSMADAIPLLFLPTYHCYVCIYLVPIDRYFWYDTGGKMARNYPSLASLYTKAHDWLSNISGGCCGIASLHEFDEPTSTGLQNKCTGYRHNREGGATPNLVMKMFPLLSWKGWKLYNFCLIVSTAAHWSIKLNPTYRCGSYTTATGKWLRDHDSVSRHDLKSFLCFNGIPLLFFTKGFKKYA